MPGAQPKRCSWVNVDDQLMRDYHDIDMRTVSKEILQERQPFDVAWRTIDGLKIRFATNGKGDEKLVLFSPWPESIFAFAPVWSGLTKQFEVFAFDLPGFGRSEARDDLFAPQTMGEFIAKALDAFGLTSVHAVGLDVGSPSVLFAAHADPPGHWPFLRVPAIRRRL
jgi:pimeloyl-ACP methyl ester carboxylesterase